MSSVYIPTYQTTAEQAFGKIEVVSVETYPIDVISVDEAKTQLRVDHDEDDQYIETLILAAVNSINNYTNRIITSTRIKYSTYTVGVKGIRLPYVSTEVYSVLDSDSADPGYTVYEYDAEDTYIQFNETDTTGEFVIEFQTGYTKDNIPPVYKESIYLLIDHWYELRELVQVRSPQKIPLMLDVLLDSERRISI